MTAKPDMRSEILDRLVNTFAETTDLAKDGDEMQLFHELLNEAYNAGHDHGEANVQAELDKTRKGFEQYRSCIKGALAWK